MQKHTHTIKGGGGTTSTMSNTDNIMGATLAMPAPKSGSVDTAGTGNSGNLQPFTVYNLLVKF